MLYKAQYVINNSLNKAIGSTPSKIFLGYEQGREADEQLREFINKLREVDVDFEKERDDSRILARTVNQQLQEYNKKKYDERHRKCSVYNVGDLVMIRALQHKPGINQKLLPKYYKGPYRIKAVLKKNRYVVTDIPGYNISSKPFNTILSTDKLKPWIRIENKVTTSVEPDTSGNDALSE